MTTTATFRRYLEAIKRLQVTPEELIAAIRDLSFPEQDAFVVDPTRSLAAKCTRRAGKSNGLGLRFFRTMAKYPGSFCPYIALTRESARNIMWPVLQEQDQKYKLGCKFTESNLTVTAQNGSRLQLFGADMKNFIRRLRGIKTPGAAVDEAQEFGSHLKELVEEILEPATADYPDGWVALTGTPGPVPVGYFYEITELLKYGYSVHGWSIFQNPYMPNAKAFVEELTAKKGWSADNPTLLREWHGQWVLDLNALVFKYEATRNHYEALPDLDNNWEYVIGVDIGFHDADAIAVIGWHPRIKEAYLVEEYVQPNQGITELAGEIEKRITRYNPLKVVMDTGGLGKKIAEELQKRYALPIVAAEKVRKFEFIELVNDALRIQRLFAKSSSRFAQDAMRVKWDMDSLKPKISDNFHSDICDAVLYAYREALHWLHEPEAEVVKAGSSEWLKRQEDEMQRAAEEMLRRQERGDDPWGWS